MDDVCCHVKRYRSPRQQSQELLLVKMTSCIVGMCCLLVMMFTVTSATRLLMIREEPYARTVKRSAPNACTNEPNNTNIEIGCRAYTTCQGGQATVVQCEKDHVYNSEKEKCDHKNNVEPPCGQWKNCTDLADGRYTDVDNDCKSYYTCSNGNFHGHNFCPEPLVYNKEKRLCDYKHDTKAPCGTAN